MTALVAVLLLVPMADAKEKELSADVQKEVKKLEGKWKATKLVVDGKDEEPTMNGADVVVEFKGRKFLLGDLEVFEIAALDPTANPKLLDFKALMDLGEISKGKTYEGIYKIDGEKLVLALYVGEGNKRPAKLESEKDSKVVVVTFERMKK